MQARSVNYSMPPWSLLLLAAGFVGSATRFWLVVHTAGEMPPKNRDSKPLLLENQTQKRRDRAQELRSARRQGVLAKRRKFDAPRATTTAAAGLAGASGAFPHHNHQQQQEEEPWSREKLVAAIQGVRERPVSEVLPYLVELRKLLSLEDPPVEEVVEGARLAPRLMELLSTANDEIQMETTWSVPHAVFGHC